MRATITFCGLLLTLVLSAQSQQQVASRKIHAVVTRTEDSRKGSGTTIREVHTTYERHGSPTEMVERDEKGQVLKWEKHTYDRKGHETSMSVLDSTGRETQRTESTYDRWGNKVTESSLEQGKLTEHTETTYDKYGDRQMERVTDAEGRQIRRTTYVYEGRGMLKTRTTYNADDKPVLVRDYTYTY